MLTAAAVFTPLGAIQATGPLFDLKILPIALGVGLLSSALPYSLEMIALKRRPAKNFGILMSLEPAIGAFSGLLFLGEILSVTQWVAIGCVIFASVGSSATLKTIKPNPAL